jgi:uncharacterized cysteine cluster protein YcgN (CxxCxxCC family)
MNPPDTVAAHVHALASQGDPEALCTHCGDCCQFAFRIDGPDGQQRYLLADLPCRHLLRQDDGTTRCAVYHDRAAQAPWCSKDLQSQLTHGVCSARCGYVQGAQLRVSEPLPAYETPFFAVGLLEMIERVADTLDADGVRRFRARWR